ncbi:MAG TPA: autotransporter-associated beta strand repeat-containing protein, partial [Candidatus Methylacidiphilales bacterium]
NGGLIIGGQSGPGGSATQTLAGISGTGSVQGNLTLNLAQSQTFGGTFAGNLTISAATTAITETLSQTPAANSFTMNGGTLSVAGISSSQTTLTLNGGNFRYTGSASNNSLGLLLGQGGGALDSSGTGALNVVNAGFSSSSGSGPRTLTLTGNSTAANTLIGDLSGSSSPTTLVKNGTGTWILSQNNGSYAGGTQINQGTLELGDSSRLGVGPVAINASGTLVITGPSFSNVSNLVAGGGTLILDNPVSVVFNGLVRSNGGGLVIVPLNPVALGVSEHVGFVGSPPTVTNGIIDASVVAANSATDTSADFLGYDTNNGLVRATYSTATAIANGGTNGTTAASVYHATGANNNVVSASSQIYALKVDSGVVVGGSSMLTIGDGVHTAGVILGGNAQGAPASIFAPINFGTSEASIYVGGSGTNLYATIGNRVIGSNGLTKNGNGFLEISDAEYSGPTTVNEGTLQLDLAGSNVVGGNTTINLAATLLFGNTAGPVNSTINLTSDGTIGASSKNSGGIQLAGTINGNGHALTVQSSETAQTVAFFGKATNLSQINVTEGALLLNGQTLAGDSTVNVGSSTPGVFGILEGAASVGQINLGANGVLRPGDGLASPVLNATGLAWNSANSELIFDLGATSNASTQLDLGSGALTKGTGSDFVFDFELGGEAGQSYTLITFGLDNTNFQASDFVAEGVDGTFSMVDDGDFESVIFTEEVPEPGTTGLMVFGAGGIMALACRKRPCVTKGNQETHIA